MTANQRIRFKDPSLIAEWLNAALKKEKEKFKKCSVNPDPGSTLKRNAGLRWSRNFGQSDGVAKVYSVV